MVSTSWSSLGFWAWEGSPGLASLGLSRCWPAPGKTSIVAIKIRTAAAETARPTTVNFILKSYRHEGIFQTLKAQPHHARHARPRTAIQMHFEAVGFANWHGFSNSVLSKSSLTVPDLSSRHLSVDLAARVITLFSKLILEQYCNCGRFGETPKAARQARYQSPFAKSFLEGLV